MDKNREFKEFVSSNANADVAHLRLKYAGKVLPFDVDSAITQIECRRKAAMKLPFLLSHEDFLFPTVLSAEQCTSECLARFHASLIPEHAKVLDMTCGLGVDDYFISRKAENVLSFEINESVAACVRSNFELLGVSNVRVITDNSVEWLEKNPEAKFDVIFADPARRGDYNTRKFAMSECSPDIPSNIDLLRRHTSHLLIKVSPMLDVSQICREIPCLKHIRILSVKNECKELLIESDFTLPQDNDPLISAYNFVKPEDIPESSVSFYKSAVFPHEEIFNDNVENLKRYLLYEPDSSVLKSGGSALLAYKFNLKKLHSNTFLYISNQFHDDFPGRIFRIKEAYKVNKIKGEFKGLRRNILCRNFPMKPSQLVSLTGVREGANKEYLIGATVGLKKKSILFDCEKI